jgi:hypothetical protein
VTEIMVRDRCKNLLVFNQRHDVVIKVERECKHNMRYCLYDAVSFDIRRSIKHAVHMEVLECSGNQSKK